MARKTRTAIDISYKWNVKEQPERLNRVYDMIFDKIIKKMNEHEKHRISTKESI